IGGGTIIERLEDVSDTEKIYRYSITDSPLPVSNYISEIKVTDNGDGTTTMEWSGQFDPRNASENDAVKVVRGIYQAGFDNLQKMFSK
ncbi:MAG TPA: SRPBCC family protein, partial [Burkholderiales bacterium]|nr:SRPBCC family protein [Burkholderiales bacterium]